MSELLPATAALRLTGRLQEALHHDIYFAQMLVNTATVEDVATLEALIKRSSDLRSNAMMPTLRAQHQNLKQTDRSLRGKTKVAIKAARGRIFKVKHQC